MIRDIKVASERTQLLKLHFVDLNILSECHRELELTILTTPEVLNCPFYAPLRDVKIGTIRVFSWLLGLHHLLSCVNATLRVDDCGLEA